MSLFIISEDGELKGNIEELKKYNSTVLEIPAEINGIKVVKIADDAFMIDEDEYYYDGGNVLENIEELKIAEGIEEIGENAFRCCFNLRSIELSNSIKVLGESVFQECEKLEKIVIPNNIVVIPAFAFSNCFELKEIILSDKVERIENDAFPGTKITNITLPKSMNFIDETVFCDIEDVVVIRKYKDLELPEFEGCDIEIVEID